MGSATESIATSNQNFMARFKEGDAAGVAALYTTNARLLPPGFDAVEGREAIEAFWKGAMGMGISGVTLTTADVEAIPSGAVETGTYVLTGGDGSQIDNGKYLVVWHEEDGALRLHWDIWNTSRS